MNLKRIAIWLAGIFVVVAVLVFVGGYAILHSKSFRRYVLAKIVQEGHETADAPGREQNVVVEDQNPRRLRGFDSLVHRDGEPESETFHRVNPPRRATWRRMFFGPKQLK